MQQRGPNTTMESDNEGKTNAPSSRGRHNSKLKFLVRSHAMREETSPPREPSSPSINVISTTETISSTSSSPLPSSNPIVVLSPSRNSPICVSPTSTLVPSPPTLSRCSSQQQQQQQNLYCSSPTNSLNDNDDIGNNDDTINIDETDPEYLNRIINNNNNKQINVEKGSSINSGNNNKKDNTSHIHNNINKKKANCDCSNESCVKCTKLISNNSTNMNSNNNNNNMVGSSNTLSVNRISNNKKIKQQSSSQTGSFEGSSSNSPCLSRDSSCEQQQYTDTSGTNLEQFIPETLNRNAKDRAFMLRIEQELVSLAKDKVKTHFKFPPMSSYQRMLVHRCAAYFGMEHNIESSGKCVVVNKTKNTRIPDKEFREHIQDDIVFNEEPPRRSILKRDSNSMEDYTFKSPDRQFGNGNSLENRRSKSFEEREEEYEKVRRRIFNRELLRQMHDGNSNDFEWTEIAWTNSDSDPSRFRLQLPEQNRRHTTGKLIKVLSEETGETLRPYVAKSYSFGGYGTGLNRGDSVVSTHSAGPRLLTKQDSGASSVSWRLSPSSSGYKSQSQMSESVTPSPTSTPHLIGESSRQDSTISEDNNNNNNKCGQESIVWAVTDIQSVPKGSIIINPQTGEPIKNEDGSLYHYDPNNPPPGIITTALKPPPSPKKKINSPQRASSNNNNSNNTNNINNNSNNISGNNERSQSPNNSCNNKKRFSKYSPNRKSHVTNSSTSPSLPYSPPLPIVQQQQQQPQPQQRSFQYVENLPPQYPVYSPTVQSGPVPDNGSVAVYQQPCIVYTTPYGVPVSPHFDGRMEATIPDMGTTYYMNIPENSTTYQQPQQQQQPSTYWNQQPINYYQTPQTNPTRFPLPVHPQGQTGYVAFPQNFLPQANQPTPPQQQQQQTTDLVPVFPSQQVQVVYSAQPPPPPAPPLQQQQQQQQTPSNTVIYPNQPNIVYTQNPVYPTPIYPPQQYPHTSTPNSCTSNFAGQISEQQQQANVMQITQNLAQMNFVSHQQISSNLGTTNPNYNINNNNRVVPSPYDVRQKSTYTSKNNGKFNNTTKFVMNSSQSSSTGTNSPATTVLTGYCPQQNLYRTPPDTPPTQFGYGANYQIPPMIFRQMSNVRANTPGTNRSSRSPTPASDIQHFDKQRIPLTARPPPPPPPPTAPTIYHGMPYVIQSNDNRIIPGRGQFNAYRQPSFTRQQQQQNSENRNYRNRKSK